MRAAVLFGVAVRLVLAWLGIGRELAWRPEICTAANSNLELREGLALARLGVSPYSGSSCRVPPLALWLQSPLADHNVLYVLPNILADVLAALLLYSLVQKLIARSSGPQQPREAAGAAAAAGSTAVLPSALAWCYLLNPLSLLPSVAGTTSPLESLAIVSALYGSCTASYGMAAAGLAAAVYMSPHAGVLAVGRGGVKVGSPEVAGKTSKRGARQYARSQSRRAACRVTQRSALALCGSRKGRQAIRKHCRAAFRQGATPCPWLWLSVRRVQWVHAGGGARRVQRCGSRLLCVNG